MNNQCHIIGLMSGTSLDGVDLVKCLFQKDKKWTYSVENSKIIPYSNFWKEKLILFDRFVTIFIAFSSSRTENLDVISKIVQKSLISVSAR